MSGRTIHIISSGCESLCNWLALKTIFELAIITASFMQRLASSSKVSGLVKAMSLFALTGLLAIQPCWAQSRDLPATIILDVPSQELQTTRTIWVSLPEGYTDEDTRYPVVYVLDGAVHFLNVVATVDFYSRYLRLPRMIVVGIDNPHRREDLTPSERADSSQSSLLPPTPFATFLADELKPFIESQYRTEPFAVLIGHSLSGLFAINSFLDQPGVFQGHIATSPSIYWDDQATVIKARTTLPSRGRLYVGLSGGERPAIDSATRALVDILDAQASDDLWWRFEEFPDHNHLTVPHQAFGQALQSMLRDFRAPLERLTGEITASGSISPLIDHYASVSSQYGFRINPPELLISLVGDRLFREHLPLANDLFRYRVELYPRSPRAHDELARGMRQAGALQAAIRSFEEAISLARIQDDDELVEEFSERLEETQRLIQTGNQ